MKNHPSVLAAFLIRFGIEEQETDPFALFGRGGILRAHLISGGVCGFEIVLPYPFVNVIGQDVVSFVDDVDVLLPVVVVG